jgi:hypothetical protein
MSISVKVAKKNGKFSFLKKHLPAILLKITDLSSLTWTFKDIAMVIYSLQHMTANDIGASGILLVMTTVIEKSLKNSNSMQSLKGQSISMLLYGLQNMTSEERDIRCLLAVTSLMIVECKDSFGAQAVGNALYGLQGMSSDCSEVRDVLSSLAIKVRTCREDLDAQAVGNALYGLQGVTWINSTPDFLSLLSFLHQQIHMIVDNFSQLAPLEGLSRSSIVTRELVTLSQSLTFLLPEISEFLNNKDRADLERSNIMIKDELACRKRDGDKFYISLGYQSKAEKRMCKIVMKISENTTIEVQNNTYLFDLFESDITLSIPYNGDSMNNNTYMIMNIEVDGIHHKNEKKILFCSRKDKYLKSKGVFVLRMDVSRMNQLKDIELEEWILRSISLAGLIVTKRKI